MGRVMIVAMPPAPPSPRPKGLARAEWLHKGLLLVFIGLAVLVGPAFMAPSGLRDTVTASAWVGWFALVLGGAFVVRHGWHRTGARRR
jgi:hypothetical protein